MELDSSQQALLALLQAGLWEKDVQLSKFKDIDLKEVYRLADEQSVVGLVTAGIEHKVDVKKVHQDAVLTFVGNSLQLEQRNHAMNVFVAELIGKLRSEDIYALLVKGQGIAQCYERPLWRSSGDVDLLMSKDNYQKALTFFSTIASSIDNEISFKKHVAFCIDGWEVEIHGSMQNGLWKKMDNGLDDLQNEIFCGGAVRSWLNNDTQVFLPRVDEDVIYVFSHILQHFFQEGIGFRQICDWCRLLWKYNENIDQKLLESRLLNMGIMSEWKAFASLSVNYLGMPTESVPFYSSDKKWDRKAKRILSLIFKLGNFGHKRDYTYYKKYPYLIYKLISLWRHTKDSFYYFLIFPQDSIKVWCSKVQLGVRFALKGKY